MWHRIASVARAGSCDSVVISHTSKRRVLYWSKKLFETPTQRQQRAGSRVSLPGLLSMLLSIGQIGLHIPGHGLRLNGKWAAVSRLQTAAAVFSLDIDATQGTTESTACPRKNKSPSHYRPPSAIIRSGQSEAAQRHCRYCHHSLYPADQPHMPLFISFVQAMQPRTRPAVGEHI